MVQNGNGFRKSQGKIQYLTDLSFHLFGNVHVRLVTLAGMVVLAISYTWYISQVSVDQCESNQEDCLARRENQEKKYVALQDELKKERENHEKIVTTLTDKHNKKSADYDDLVERNTELRKAGKVPTLIFPLDNRPIIGQYVTFKWDYQEKLGFRNFVLELWSMGPQGTSIKRYPIPEGHNRRKIVFQFPEPVTGQFFWRIGTGELLHDYRSSLANGSIGDGMLNHYFLDSTLASSRLSRLWRKKQLIVESKHKGGAHPEEETRLWSRFGSFSIYPSVWEKLKRTQILVVGTTAAYLSYDYPVDCRGRPDSYDMDFVRWIAKKLEPTLKAEVKVEHHVQFELDALTWKDDLAKKERKKFGEGLKRFMDRFELRVITKIIEWEEIFTSVTNGDVDLIIANLTKSNTREEEHPGLEFTDGYRKNEQTIIASRIHSNISGEADMRRILQDQRLAVQQKTTNYKAAMALRDYLREKEHWEFKIDQNYYPSYVDVIDQIRSGKTPFGMIDRVRFDSVGYPDLIALHCDLKPLLEEFNIKEFGAKEEEYAIGVASHGGRNLFLSYLNRIIKEGEAKRTELELKHNGRRRRNREGGCSRPEAGPRRGKIGSSRFNDA